MGHAVTFGRSRICVTTSRLTTFSDGVRGNSVEDLHGLRPGVLRHALSIEKLLELLERRRRPALHGNDRGARALAQALVGDRHDGDLADIGMTHDHRLDLGGHDRHAAAADDVLATPDVDELSVFVEVAEVAGSVAAPCGQ